jgi:psiF repeat
MKRESWFNWREPIHFARQANLTFKGNRMKNTTKIMLAAICAALPFFAASANAQTTRASCEADAKTQNITGADRLAFMKACLPAGESADKPAKPAKAAKVAKKAKSSKAVKAKKTKTTKTAKAKKPATVKTAS